MNLLEVFTNHDRVVVAGPPRSGKSSGCASSNRWVLATDLYVLEGVAWDEVPGRAMADLAALDTGRWVLEGCRAPWCLRAGLVADAAVWLGRDLETLEAGQRGLAVAARSVWEEWLAAGPGMAAFEL